jgi:hypothetical protein
MLGPAKDILIRGPTSNPKLTSLPHGSLAMFLISSRQQHLLSIVSEFFGPCKFFFLLVCLFLLSFTGLTT